MQIVDDIAEEPKHLEVTLNDVTGNITWSPSSSSIIKIIPSSDGKSADIEALAEGTETIIVECNGKTSTCDATVTSVKSITGVTFKGTIPTSVEVEESVTVKIDTINPEGATGDLTWHSSDETKAAVVAVEGTNGRSATINGIQVTGENEAVTITVKNSKGTTVGTITGLKVKEPQIIGKTINYSATYQNGDEDDSGWEILYYDDDNVYIITKGWVAASSGLTINGYNGTSDFTTESINSRFKAIKAGLLYKTCTSSGYVRFSSSYNSMKGTEWLIDSSVWNWSRYVINGKADWAIGAPTLELLAMSYDKVNGTTSTIADAGPSTHWQDSKDALYGYYYPAGWESPNKPLTYGTVWNRDKEKVYYVADPARFGSNSMSNTMLCVHYENISATFRDNTGNAFRPVVHLTSKITDLVWDEEHKYYTWPQTGE